MTAVALGIVRQLAAGGAFVELEDLPGYRVGPCVIPDACSETLAQGDTVLVADLGFNRYAILERVGTVPVLATRAYAAAQAAAAQAAAIAHADAADLTTLATADTYAAGQAAAAQAAAIAAAATHADAGDVAALATAETYAATQDAALIPPGSLIMFGGQAAPAGWLWCDGSSLLRATWPGLFAAIGTSHGAVDGTHFSLPNLAAGAFPRGAAAGAVGASGGAASHAHTLGAGYAEVTEGGTAHAINRVVVASWNATVSSTATGLTTSTAAQNTAAQLAGSTDTAAALPPYLTLGFIIKT